MWMGVKVYGLGMGVKVYGVKVKVHGEGMGVKVYWSEGFWSGHWWDDILCGVESKGA